LIRSATDTGIVVVLDPRIHNKWYGRYFLRALPDAPVVQDPAPPGLQRDQESAPPF
jgi:ATP-dependent DNA helicase DinG